MLAAVPRTPLYGNQDRATGVDRAVYRRIPTRRLEDQGCRGLRFWNNEGLRDVGGIAVSLKRYLQAILAALADPCPGTPLRGAPPSPTRGEG
jgi:hypothetical protein